MEVLKYLNKEEKETSFSEDGIFNTVNESKSSSCIQRGINRENTFPELKWSCLNNQIKQEDMVDIFSKREFSHGHQIDGGHSKLSVTATTDIPGFGDLDLLKMYEKRFYENSDTKENCRAICCPTSNSEQYLGADQKKFQICNLWDKNLFINKEVEQNKGSDRYCQNKLKISEKHKVIAINETEKLIQSKKVSRQRRENLENKLKMLKKDYARLSKQQKKLMMKKDAQANSLLLENIHLQDEISRQISSLFTAIDAIAADDSLVEKQENQQDKKDGIKIEIKKEECRTEGQFFEKQENQQDKKDGIKIEIKKEECRTEGQFFDAGTHWCEQCNDTFPYLHEYLRHLQDHKHLQHIDPNYRPWHPEVPAKCMYPTEDPVTAIQGVQFMMPVSGFYCSLCDKFTGDANSSELHLKNETHNFKYKQYVLDTTSVEQRSIQNRFVKITQKPDDATLEKGREKLSLMLQRKEDINSKTLKQQRGKTVGTITSYTKDSRRHSKDSVKNLNKYSQIKPNRQIHKREVLDEKREKLRRRKINVPEKTKRHICREEKVATPTTKLPVTSAFTPVIQPQKSEEKGVNKAKTDKIESNSIPTIINFRWTAQARSKQAMMESAIEKAKRIAAQLGDRPITLIENAVIKFENLQQASEKKRSPIAEEKIFCIPTTAINDFKNQNVQNQQSELGDEEPSPPGTKDIIAPYQLLPSPIAEEKVFCNPTTATNDYKNQNVQNQQSELGDEEPPPPGTTDIILPAP